MTCGGKVRTAVRRDEPPPARTSAPTATAATSAITANINTALRLRRPGRRAPPSGPSAIAAPSGRSWGSLSTTGITTVGITTVGIGFTTPSYHGFVIDIDGYLYQATRASGAGSTLGDELDTHLRYPIRDQFTLSCGMAYFKSGLITDPNQSIARKYTIEASGRF